MKMMKAYIVRGTCVEVATKHHKVSIGVFHPPHQLLHLVIRCYQIFIKVIIKVR